MFKKTKVVHGQPNIKHFVLCKNLFYIKFAEDHTRKDPPQVYIWQVPNIYI